MTTKQLVRIGMTLILVTLVSTAVWAQSSTTGAIAGVVRDTTGAVLPGVTVEAASPALIEKVRAAVTDEQGNYRIIDLRPGTYTVTFTLPGFSTFRREGIELTVGFTAPVNAELRVGSLEETVTVTGESPLVDVQNVRTQRVLQRDVLDALPTFKSAAGFAALTLGATSGVDVGGDRGEGVSGLNIHGSRGNDLRWKQDGMAANSTVLRTGSVRTHRMANVGIQEIVVEAGGGAEAETGGTQLNYIPRDGGNTFSLYGFSAYSNNSLQGSNLSDELRARGLAKTPEAKEIWDYGIGVGGPIKRDRLWFYQSNRWWGGSSYPVDTYFNKSVGSIRYEPDLSRRSYTRNFAEDFGGRVTWQAGAKHKISGSETIQRNCNCVGGNNTTSPEASTDSDNFWNQIGQATWNYTATNKLLLMGGFSWAHFPQNSHMVLGTTPDTFGVHDLGTGVRYNAKSTADLISDYGENRRRDSLNEQFSVSYVTGSHAVKVGVQLAQAFKDHNTYMPQSLTLRLRNGVPNSLIQWALPATIRTRVRTQAVYAQDQWTIRRLTLNVGARFDAVQGWTLPEEISAGNPSPARVCPKWMTREGGCTWVDVTGRFIEAQDLPQIKDVPNFTDLSPRLSAAYDLFGNGKTAVKASLNRYVGGIGGGLAESVHPMLENGNVSTTTRTWSDANGNFVPDCDLQNRGANGECGAIANQNFAKAGIRTARSDDVTTGFGNREYSWMASAGVQHELRPGMALDVMWYRTWFGNFTTSDNTLVSPGDHDPYCVTAPVDARLPGGGGSQICGLYDIQKAKFGQVDNLITTASTFGTQREVFTSVDIGLNARFANGGFMGGGVSVGRQSTQCVEQDAPVQPGFCDVTPPWSAGTQFKLHGVYPLPWDVEAAAVFQNLPGTQILASFNVPNSAIAPSLGRNLAACPTATGACTATAPVGLVRPGEMYEDRLTQVDVRFSKIIRVGRGRIKGMFDIYNLFNANTILGLNSTYGSNWQRPSDVLGPRLFKFGAEVNF